MKVLLCHNDVINYLTNMLIHLIYEAITAVDIKKAMDNLQYPNENEAKAVDVRQELDLKVYIIYVHSQYLVCDSFHHLCVLTHVTCTCRFYSIVCMML